MDEFKIDTSEQLTDQMTVTTQQAIKRCAQQISSVQVGSVPFAREMGVTEILPVSNSPIARDEYAADVELQLEEWETRATPSEVICDEDGDLKVVMEVTDDDGE